ncbi:DUF6443 domain-containing protein [Prevotella sp. 10(H)]|uniref:DUF6443 domain-containing protein n=1 Tax=Prevotella sp. 10(H) TaxID=1158294 RepID=UPI0018CC359C|nr:DUF6443 domain-containing protein [Prevotella sp. 10(H)]
MKKYIFSLYFLLLSVGLSSQSSIILSSEHTQGGSELACQTIQLKPGFVFTAATGKSLTLSVNPSTCDPFAGKSSSLSSSQNYIQTKTYTNAEGSRYMESIQYFDGLGRPEQVVQRGITPSVADLVSYQQYDGLGRESNSWLPAVVPGNNGAYQSFASFKEKALTTYNKDSAYSKPVYEPSPLNRIREQYGPGKEWYTGKKSVRTEYLTNTASGELSCVLFKVTGSGTSTGLSKSSTPYAAGELYVTKLSDEDDNITYEFKDKLGQVVLTRQINGSAHDTYYVYDDFGNLSYVLPPLAADTINKVGVKGELIELLGYLYKYDNRNRCVIKKLPGADSIFYVYDKADRLIFTQDGEQRLKGEWAFSIPDAFGRPVLTGICTTVNKATIKAGRFDNYIIRAEFTSSGTHQGYNVKVGQTAGSLNTLSIENPKILSVNYYDNYNFRSMAEFSSTETEYKAQSGYGVCYGDHQPANAYKSKGLLTGTLTAQQQSDGTLSGTYLYSVMYYDNKGQPVQVKSNNHLGGTEKEYLAYNFTGQPVKKMHVHAATGQTTQTETYSYLYDHAGRLVETKHKLNTGPEVVLAWNEYDEQGRLKSSQKAGTASLKSNYTYNIRSWTKSITSPLFSQTLFYNDKVTAHAYSDSDYKRSFSGNISGMEWKAGTEAMRSNRFKYDALSRLTHSAYNGVTIGGKYNVNYTYDKQGNIMTLHRRGMATASLDSNQSIDNLTMKYTGNQLINVTDNAPDVTNAASADFKDKKGTGIEYTYNKNGAMVKDLNKGITQIKYNSLNLPQSIEIDNLNTKGRIKYTYSAAGQKLKVIHESDINLQTATIMATAPFAAQVEPDKTTDYVGNKVYENGKLKRILIDGGYIEGSAYYFFMTDHLGNNRVVANQRGTAIQTNHYYPFGMAYAENSTTEQGKQPYKYNGKELDQHHQLNMYDYSARFYEPGIGRFSTVDPLAEKYYSISPYAYTANNPIKFIDPDGKQVGFPITSPLGNKTQVNQAYLNQKYPYGASMGKKIEEALYNMAPTAVGISVGGKAALGAFAEGKLSMYIVIKGKDSGPQFYATGSVGVETNVELSANAVVETVHAENENRFRGSDMEGPSTEISLDVAMPTSKFVSGSVSKAQSKSKHGGKIDNYGVGASVGVGTDKLFGSLGKIFKNMTVGVQENNTKGFKTNSYKDEEKK